jgi:hypothetical protein
MHGATLLWQGASLRYDDRQGGDYAERGVGAELSAEIVEGLAGSPTFWRTRAQVSGILPELRGLSGAARIAWSTVSSAEAPFYQQSKLGGSFMLRGFTLDRFIDRQAWIAEVEQRIRIFRTHIYGVETDWRMDRCHRGQVFGASTGPPHPRLAVGLGLRSWPNVVGRVDLPPAAERCVRSVTRTRPERSASGDRAPAVILSYAHDAVRFGAPTRQRRLVTQNGALRAGVRRDRVRALRHSTSRAVRDGEGAGGQGIGRPGAEADAAWQGGSRPEVAQG